MTDPRLPASAGDGTRPLFQRAAEAALAGAMPLRDNGYKVRLTTALVRRALDELVT